MLQDEPIRITDIITEEIGTPSNDGTRGSALYKVPIRLSRQPSRQWADLFEQTWDNPPAYTSMHRPGICRVLGDTIILTRTTVEEVEQVHKETLQVVLREVNSQLEGLQRRAAEQEAVHQRREAEHRDHVTDAAKRIRFDE